MNQMSRICISHKFESCSESPFEYGLLPPSPNAMPKTLVPSVPSASTCLSDNLTRHTDTLCLNHVFPDAPLPNLRVQSLCLESKTRLHSPPCRVPPPTTALPYNRPSQPFSSLAFSYSRSISLPGPDYLYLSLRSPAPVRSLPGHGDTSFVFSVMMSRFLCLLPRPASFLLALARTPLLPLASVHATRPTLPPAPRRCQMHVAQTDSLH